MFARLLIAAVLAALVVPGVAQAHHTAVPIVALDYGNRILTGSAGQAGVRPSVDDAGRKLRLTVAPGHSVTVLGYAGEPFLRFDSMGVRAAVHSPTARGLGLVPTASKVQIGGLDSASAPGGRSPGRTRGPGRPRRRCTAGAPSRGRCPWSWTGGGRRSAAS